MGIVEALHGILDALHDPAGTSPSPWEVRQNCGGMLPQGFVEGFNIGGFFVAMEINEDEAAPAILGAHVV